MSYTKGPWRVSKGKARRVTSEHGAIICNAVLRNQGGPKHKANLKDEHEAEANADLIAAAPCLLGALVALRNEVSGTPRPGTLISLVSAADRAIAKAIGAGA